MHTIRRLLLAVVFVPALFCPILASADDTEVFFASSYDSENQDANVLFMFDISGSMGQLDGTPYRRITRLKQAMLELLDGSDGVNIGIGAFNGGVQGGAILYPSVDPDSDACPDAGCGEISLRVPVRSPSDDAEQAPDGRVSTTSDTLELTRESANVVEATYALGSTDDNAVELDGGLIADPSSLPLFHVATSSAPARIGLRFPDVDVPAGANVVSAEIRFRALGAANVGQQGATISLDGSLDVVTGLGSPPFADTAGRRVGDRPRIGTPVEWDSIPVAATGGDPVDSVDIGSLIGTRVAQSDWAAGDALALLLEISGPTAADADNHRTFKSHGHGTAPVLTVRYTAAAAPDNRVGIRFADVAVPRGATITHAAIEFLPTRVQSEASAMTVRGEGTGHARTFSDVTNDISRRTPTSAAVPWLPEPWDNINRENATSDLTTIVQEIVNRADWCGGNALAVLFEGNGLRTANARDGGIWDAPALRVGYDAGSVDFATTCTHERTVARVAGPGDDGEENVASDANELGTPDLDTSRDADGRMIALRFDAVDVARGAAVQSAYLKLASAGSEGEASFEIGVAHAPELTTAFDGANRDIGRRAVTPGVTTWTAPVALAGESVVSVDIGAQIENAVGQGGWNAGDALVVTLRQSAGDGYRRFRAYESGATAAARLEINHRVEGSAVGGARRTLRTARDEMVEIVSGLRQRGGTPLTDSYYESALYMLGRPVDFGKTRGSGKKSDRYYRTSTPLSWTGGELYTPPDCDQVDPNAVACVDERVPDGAIYSAPVAGSCQANQIVLLSDGSATTGSGRSRIADMIGGGECAVRDNAREECGIELSEWLKDGDPSSSRAPIITHTVGFNFSNDFLRDLAAAGGGRFQEASSASELAGVFRNIVDAAATIDTGFVAPAATVSQFNRLANRNDVYFAMFRPSLTTRWDGNLKRYEINKPPGQDEAILVDALVQPAIDESSGEFAPGAKSFWTDGLADGADVAAGGAAHELALPRTLYTYEGAPSGAAPLSVFGVDNAAIDAAALGIDPAGGEYRARLLAWASGVDVLDVDGDGDFTEVRHQIGDPMHSSPFVLSYPGTEEGETRSIVFVGTNEGFLHAIDAEDGSETFGFIPPELFGNLDDFFADRVVVREAGEHDRPYGLDGEIGGWHEDLDRDGLVDVGESAYLYFGMRRGGRNYYALDVSDPDAPSLAWVIRGGSGDFAELGQTWSTPVHTRVRDGSAERDVLVFGAGYDAGGDARTVREPATEDSVGRGLFVVDAKTGDRLAHVGPTFHSDLDYSIPSTVSVVDIDLDGFADMFWVGDTGARVWRFDIETGGDGTLAERIRGSVAADLGSVGTLAARRFHYPPDVTLVQDEDGTVFMNVGIGSGWRAHPLDTTVEDRFYMLRTTDYFGPPRDDDGNVAYPSAVTESALFDASAATTRTAGATEVENGWYLRFPSNGEKVLGAALTVDGQVLFTSYVPEAEAETSDGCSVSVGGGRLYALDAITAEAVIDLDGSMETETGDDALSFDDRSRRLRAPGIPAPISVLLPESANPRGSAEITLDVRTKGERLEMDTLPAVTRTHWAEHAE